MDSFIGILELAAWALAILAVASLITYLVITATKKLEARRQATAAAAGPPTEE